MVAGVAIITGTKEADELRLARQALIEMQRNVSGDNNRRTQILEERPSSVPEHVRMQPARTMVLRQE